MRKSAPTVIGREQKLSTALSLVQSGASVDIVGSRGSGRSTFLASLRNKLEADEWTVVSVRGVASLRQHPLAAMHLAGIGGPNDPRVGSTIQSTADALRAVTKPDRSVLFLDDWDDLDESSWGVAESVRRMTGLPIVLSRLLGLRARHTPSGLTASTLEPSFVIELSPIRFDELEKALASHLGAPIEIGTMSRLFAKSGGIVGLARNLVDAAVLDGRLRRIDGAWSASRDLWSPGLRGVLEAHLEGLGEDARDALEVIALVGVADVETVRKLVSWETLELLEERAMVRLVASGSRRLVTVVPPLVVEFFRHEPSAARRIRLTELIMERLASTESMDAILANLTPPDEHVPDDDALFVRLLQERARTRRIVAHAEWVSNPNATTVVAYARALLQTNVAHGTIEDAFSKTDPAKGDAASRAEYAILRAQWRAYVHGDLDGALGQLRDETRSLGGHGRSADAAAVIMEANLRSIPDDFAVRLEVTDELPERVKVTLQEAQMAVLIALGRISDARRVYGCLGRKETSVAGFLPNVLFGLALLGDGDYAAARAWAMRGIDEAHGHLDVEATRGHGYVAALCLAIAGEYAAADEIIDTVLAIGEPPPYPLSSQLALLNIASVVAVRRGNVGAGEKFLGDSDNLFIPDGPLPGQARSLPKAQLLAFNGNIVGAADLLWSSAVDLWERGGRFAAALGFLSSLEIHTVPDRLEDAQQRLAEMDCALLLPHLAFIRARENRSAQALLECVDGLVASGRPGLAVNALRLAEERLLEEGEVEAARGVHERQRQLVETLGATEIDTARFLTTAVNLTERELEIARSVAEGLTNVEIATRLVLSKRTVESHLHRIMRKTGVENRKQLAEYVRGLPPE